MPPFKSIYTVPKNHPLHKQILDYSFAKNGRLADYTEHSVLKALADPANNIHQERIGVGSFHKELYTKKLVHVLNPRNRRIVEIIEKIASRRSIMQKNLEIPVGMAHDTPHVNVKIVNNITNNITNTNAEKLKIRKKINAFNKISFNHYVYRFVNLFADELIDSAFDKTVSPYRRKITLDSFRNLAKTDFFIAELAAECAFLKAKKKFVFRKYLNGVLREVLARGEGPLPQK